MSLFARGLCRLGFHWTEYAPGRDDLRRCQRCGAVEQHNDDDAGGVAGGSWTTLTPQEAKAAELREFRPKL